MLTIPRRTVAPLAMLVVALVAVACSGPTPSSPPPSPSASTVPSPSLAPSGSPEASSPPPSESAASPSASAGEACGVQPDSGLLPSDRITDVRISETPGADVVTFVFGEKSSPAPPQGNSEGAIQAAEPPYTEGASGLEIDIDAEHVVQVVFTGMTLVDEDGNLTYDGQLDFETALPSVKRVVNFDMFEGHNSWYIGYDGTGCVTLMSAPNEVSVVVGHPAS
jgi:hypothetical protein